MAIVSDSNILSSFAAADELDLLFQILHVKELFIPRAVEQELHVGLEHGAIHLHQIFDHIQLGKIQVLELASTERTLTESLPRKLNAGEREGIVLCQQRRHLFLSNDNRAVRFCQKEGVKTVNLEALLRSIWVQSIRSRSEVDTLIERMQDVENLKLNQLQRDKIFAPRRSGR